MQAYLKVIPLIPNFDNMTITALYEIYKKQPSVQTDTRKIKKDDLFFALKGPNFNGNNFALNALEAGAAYCVCDEHFENTNEKIIIVTDVLTTLQDLAKYHRQQFNIPFIAITGSNGKTTTKELMYAVLSSHYKCYTTQGNLNNHIGVPLTILSIKKDAEMAVIEMGANHQKEIESYCAYTLPNYGLITNCGKAHLEGFGGVEGVKKGKGELYNYLAENEGTIFINTDYDYLKEMGKNVADQIAYGTSAGFVRGKLVNTDAQFLAVQFENYNEGLIIQTRLAGSYNLPNVLAAVCVGDYFDVPTEKIKNAIENYEPTNSRSQIIIKDTNTILIDAYNANPSSMQVAIENFAAMEGKNKILILGGMMELGIASLAEHKSIVCLLQKYTWQQVVLTGVDYKNVPTNFIHFTTTEATTNWYKKQNFKNCTILIKGSRSMGMERVLD